MSYFSCFWEIPNWKFTDVLAFVWDGLKAAVPAAVAWVAYKVSIEAKEATQAQRDIAANQYKISLYDLRKKNLLSLDEWLSENVPTSNKKIDKIDSIINILHDIENTFSIEINNEKIKDSINDIMNMNLDLSCDEKDLDHKKFNSTSEKERLKCKISDNNLIINRKFDSLSSELKKISDQCRQLLHVPSSPY